MHVYSDLFDGLDISERNEDLFAVEAPTSPFVKGKWHIHKLPTIFVYACFLYFSLSMCRCYWYHYGKTVQSSTPILAGLESYYNLVDMLSYAKIKCFSKTRFQMYPRLRTTWRNLTKKTTWSNYIVNRWRISTCQCGNCEHQTC